MRRGRRRDRARPGLRRVRRHRLRRRIRNPLSNGADPQPLRWPDVHRAEAIDSRFRRQAETQPYHGFASIGALSESCGTEGYGTKYRFRINGQLEGDKIPIDFVENARSLGAHAVRATTRAELEDALRAMADHKRTTVVVIETDRDQRVPGYESWWDVPIAEVSEVDAVQQARKEWEAASKKERYYL